MSPEDFAAWLAHMGWSQRRAAKELGCSPNSVAAWLRYGAPPHIGFACAALAFGLPTWRTQTLTQ
jgi:transcriptional regulator with XRE-family HTH domain